MDFSPSKDMHIPNQDQSNRATSPDIPDANPSSQPNKDDDSDFPFSGMSFEEFERQ